MHQSPSEVKPKLTARTPVCIRGQARVHVHLIEINSDLGTAGDISADPPIHNQYLSQSVCQNGGVSDVHISAI